MEPAAAKLAAALESTPIGEPRFPVFANGSAAPFADIRRELSENLLRPVRFRETLLALRANGVDRFAEFGPGAVLTGLVKRTLAASRGRGVKAGIFGIGAALPEHIVTNAHWAQRLDTTDEWIVRRTGIHERRWLNGDGTMATLAAQACDAALRDAGRTAGEVDQIIVTTITPGPHHARASRPRCRT